MRAMLLTLTVGLSAWMFTGDAMAQTGRQSARAAATEVSGQERVPARRVRRIEVFPRYRYYVHPYYPRPGYVSWPGPNAHRECRDWLQLEHRPSGTVLTPQMQCWWAPGRVR